MKTTKEKTQLTLQKKILKRLGIPTTIFLVSLLLAVNLVTPVFSSIEPMPGAVINDTEQTPTPSPSAVASTSKTVQPNTATVTPTQSTVSSNQGKNLLVTRDDIKLRKGPGVQYDITHSLTVGDELVVLGRTADNIWVYVRAPKGEEGWVKAILVSTAGMRIEDKPIKTPEPPPTTTGTVTASSINLRAGPGAYFSSAGMVEYGDTVELLGKLDDSSWIYIKTADKTEGWIEPKWVYFHGFNIIWDYVPLVTAPPTETSTPVVLTDVEGRWIDIDLSEQRLRAYEGTKLVGNFLVSTGIPPFYTEPGQFHIYMKFRWDDMAGPDYYLPNVPYSMYYNNNFSIHGTYWHRNFGTRMSHGCVNMDTADAEWLYNWADLGTLVNIHS